MSYPLGEVEDARRHQQRGAGQHQPGPSCKHRSLHLNKLNHQLSKTRNRAEKARYVPKLFSRRALRSTRVRQGAERQDWGDSPLYQSSINCCMWWTYLTGDFRYPSFWTSPDFLEKTTEEQPAEYARREGHLPVHPASLRTGGRFHREPSDGPWLAV